MTFNFPVARVPEDPAGVFDAGDAEGVPAALELGQQVEDEAVLGAHRPRAVPRVHLSEVNERSCLGFEFSRPKR